MATVTHQPVSACHQEERIVVHLVDEGANDRLGLVDFILEVESVFGAHGVTRVVESGKLTDKEREVIQLDVVESMLLDFQVEIVVLVEPERWLGES